MPDVLMSYIKQSPARGYLPRMLLLFWLATCGSPPVWSQHDDEESEQATPEYRYWDWGVTPKRDDYQVRLLRLALEKTRASHGEFRIVRVKARFSTPRVRRELSRGKIINVQVGPWRRLSQSLDRGADPAIRIDIPIDKGLWGYRHVIIRRENLARFAAIEGARELRQMLAGQVRGWVDIDIYRANGFRVADSSNIGNLLAMLNAKRYDYVPMGIVEAPLLLASKGEKAEQMLVAPAPLIYFPLPFVFYLSIHEPEMAQRLEQGLRVAQADGSFDALFAQTFAAELEMIRAYQGGYIQLDNPLLPPAMRGSPAFLQQSEIAGARSLPVSD
uniref:hypothetical protein n=1 Tax=Cellvibrio fontiphilus TaxID=1815559 RepID=UPI002B4C123B|nr:hypothetical protein [Cellvibrio fontiphilus]